MTRYVEALHNKHIRHDVIKGARAKFSEAIALAKNRQRIWEKVRGKGAMAQTRKVGRQIGDRKPPTWDRKMKQEEIELEKWEEVPNGRAWMQGYGFYKATPGQLRLTGWTCHHKGHRTVNGPMKWGLPPDYEPRCTRCSYHGHKVR